MNKDTQELYGKFLEQNMIEDLVEIYEKLLEQNYTLKLFGDLNILLRGGRGNITICPFHEDKKATFSYFTDKPRWHCFGCGESGDWVRYLEKKEGLTIHGALKQLAEDAGIDLRGYDRTKWEKERDHTNILDLFLGYFIKQLWSDSGDEVWEFLKGRGFQGNELTDSELGFYPSQEELGEYLLVKGYSLDLVGNFGLNARGLGYKPMLVIPYPDHIGGLKGFIFREITKDRDKLAKHISTYELEKGALFNLYEARGQNDLVVVEDFLDSILATQKGLRGVVALGDSSLTGGQVEVATKYGIKNFIIVLNKGSIGQIKTEKALDLLKGKGVNGYVVTPSPNYEFLWEFIKDEGIDEFKTMIAKAESGIIWKTKRILEKYDLQTDKGFNDALFEVMVYQEILDPLEKLHCKITAGKMLGVSENTLDQLFRDYHEKIVKEQSHKEKKPPFK